MRVREVCTCGSRVDVDADDPAPAVRDWRARHTCPHPPTATPVVEAVPAPRPPAPPVGFTRPPTSSRP